MGLVLIVSLLVTPGLLLLMLLLLTCGLAIVLEPLAGELTFFYTHFHMIGAFGQHVS
ncbi:MAG: hypothetical protein ACOCZM_02520 [Bacillota bacterium]